MQARPFAFAALAVGALAAFTAAQSTQRYRVEVASETTVDLTALGGPVQHQNTTSNAYLTIAMSDTVGGRRLLATLDSLVPDSTSPIPASMLDSARGRTATAFLSDAGRLTELSADTTSPIAGSVFPILHNFFPRARASAKVGDKWTDTLEYASEKGPSGGVNVRMVANWVVMGNEVHDGVQARKILAAYSSARSGTIEGPQGSMSLDGTGTGNATYWVTPAGALVGGTLTEDVQMKITSAGAPAPIPLTTKSTITISGIK
jgi:hypothetical protein